MIIKYFSWVKDIVGKSEETISISSDINTPEKLIDFLITKNELYKKAFSKRATIKVAQNKIYISKSTKITNDDEIFLRSRTHKRKFLALLTFSSY